MRVYNSISNASKWVLFLPPSDVNVRSFLYPFYILINSIAQKLVSSPRLNSSPLEVKNSRVFSWVQQQPFSIKPIFLFFCRKVTWICPNYDRRFISFPSEFSLNFLFLFSSLPKMSSITLFFVLNIKTFH